MAKRTRGARNAGRNRTYLTTRVSDGKVATRPVIGNDNGVFGDVDRFAEFVVETMAHLRKEEPYRGEVRPVITLLSQGIFSPRLEAQFLYRRDGVPTWESHHDTFGQIYPGRTDRTKDGLEARGTYIDTFLRELTGSIGSSPNNGFFEFDKPMSDRLSFYVPKLRVPSVRVPSLVGS